MVNSDCASNLACMNQKCTDPCRGSCGPNAECRVQSHSPRCTCSAGYTGDPFSGCFPDVPCKTHRPLIWFVEKNLNPPIVHYIVIEEKRNPCSFNPCGVNAECRELNGAGSCRCLPEYYGDPHVECRPECVTNSDCPKHLSCSNQKCRDPCPGTCGLNAECNVVNHSPSCLCPTGYTGNPLLNCFIQPITPPPRKILQWSIVFFSKEKNLCYHHILCYHMLSRNVKRFFFSVRLSLVWLTRIKPDKYNFLVRDENPCDPSPCGPYSQCRTVNQHAVCICSTNYIGSPPNCRPECVVSSDCAQDKSCMNQRCKDPCPGTCGLHARCQIVNHNPICSCPSGYSGDPFVRCIKEQPSKIKWSSSIIRFSALLKRPPNCFI